jgi:secretion/DNA translocation related CpaE-like protein
MSLSSLSRADPSPASVCLLVVTGDPRIVDTAARTAAAAGCMVEVVETATAARSRWSAADVVLLGADLVAEVAATTPPRRAATLLVVTDPPSIEVMRCALAVGVDDVVRVPSDEGTLVTRIAEVTDGPSRQAPVIAVRAAAGGLGASTVAAGLALTAARSGVHVLLVDGAVTGPGIDLLLGLEHHEGMRWPDLTEVSGRISAVTLTDALPCDHGVAVLSWDRRGQQDLSATALAAVLDAGRRGFGLVIVDDAGMSATPGLRAVLARCVTSTVLVLDDSVRSVVSAARLRATPGAVVEPIHIVVRGDASSADTVRKLLGVDVAATITDDSALPRAAMNGDPPSLGRRSGLHAACRAVLGRTIGTAAVAR